MKAANYKFIFPNTVKIDMDEGRKVLARSLDGITGSNQFFHYGEGNKPLPDGMSKVRTWSNKNKIEIVAIGDEMMSLTQSFMPNFIAGFLKEFGVMPSISVINEPIDVEYANEPYFYVAHSMIVDRGLKACKVFEEMNEEQRLKKVHGVLIRGLERQAAELGFDLPATMPSIHGIKILKYHPRAKIVYEGNKVIQHGISVNLGFFWNASIKGSWCVGGVTSKGHGRIWYAPAVLQDILSGEIK
jgi:hypothetical protein